MSNQCRSCGRDLNNNYIPYTNAYAGASNSNVDRESNSAMSTTGVTASSSSSPSPASLSSTSSISSRSMTSNNNLCPIGKSLVTGGGIGNSNGCSNGVGGNAKSTNASQISSHHHHHLHHHQTQLTAKVMFGTVGAIKELREKEKSRHTAARATDRRN